MEIKVTKTGKPGYGFNYLDYIDFGKHNLAPMETDFDKDYCKQVVEVDYDDERNSGVEYIAPAEILGQHITSVQLCGPGGGEIIPEGDDLYNYIERRIEISADDGQTYIYIDSEDGPIVTRPSSEYSIMENDYEEFLGQIVDTFEDFLDSAGMTIKSDERAADIMDLVEDGEYASVEEAIEGECPAHIYGGDYDIIADAYRQISGSWDDGMPAPVSRDAAKGYVDRITEAFTDIMKERGAWQENGEPVSDADLSFSMENENVKEKVLDTFTNWGLCSIDLSRLDGTKAQDPEL